MQYIYINSDGRNKHQIYWHIGQMYACNNDYENAIKYIKKSSSIFNRMFDEGWRWYYKGTIAFLDRDKDKLYHYYSKLNNSNTGYYWSNLETLKSLYENFDKSYIEAYNHKSK